MPRLRDEKGTSYNDDGLFDVFPLVMAGYRYRVVPSPMAGRLSMDGEPWPAEFCCYVLGDQMGELPDGKRYAYASSHLIVRPENQVFRYLLAELRRHRCCLVSRIAAELSCRG